MSDIEDDIYSRMFGGNLYLQDILGSETSHFEGLSSLSLLNTSAIYAMGKFYRYERPQTFCSLLGLPADTINCNQCAGN